MAPLVGPLVWFAIWCTNGASVAMSHVFAPDPFLSRALPLLISTSLIGATFLVPQREHDFRGVVALASTFYAIKVKEVVLESRYKHEPLWIKIASVIGTFFDAQERQLCKSWKEGRAAEVFDKMLTLLFHFVSYMVAVQVFQGRRNIAEAVLPSTQFVMESERLRTVVGCISACLVAFFSLHLYGDILHVVWLLLGFRFPALMDSPEKSLSVAEFWRRWNTVIQKLLTKYVFRPARHAGLSPKAAISLTFFASGLVHILPIIVSRSDDWLAAASMMGYFAVQFSVMIVEKYIGIETWNPWFARLWTVFHLFGPSYLLVFPCLRIANTQF